MAIVMYATAYCPYCVRAKGLLTDKGADFTVIDVDEQLGARQEMMSRSGRRTVPQIFIGDQHIGGCDDLFALEQQGQLDELLNF